MEFYKTEDGRRFFGKQLPDLIDALTDIASSLKAPTPVFQLEQTPPPNFLVDLYNGFHDSLESADPDVLHTHDAGIIACQEQMRKELTPEVWERVEQYRALLDDRGAVEREQAFAAGFQYAAKLLAAGLAASRKETTPN